MADDRGYFVFEGAKLKLVAPTLGTGKTKTRISLADRKVKEEEGVN
jgi:hypothetical protein